MEQQTLVISNSLFSRLRTDAEDRGMSIEELVGRAVEMFERQDDELQQRAEAMREVDEIYQRMQAKYGRMPDSTELLREDRAR